MVVRLARGAGVHLVVNPQSLLAGRAVCGGGWDLANLAIDNIYFLCVCIFKIAAMLNLRGILRLSSILK